MAEVFFEFLMTPYLYDTKQSKLFQIEHNRLIEIGDPKILKSVRFNSVEIGRERAFIIAQNFTNIFLH
jgi:hypothetical protein